MAGMLEISDIKHLKRYDSYAKGSGGKFSMQEQMGNVSREIGILRKLKNCRIQKLMKNSFHGLISQLDIAKEGITELEDVRIEIFETGKQR